MPSDDLADWLTGRFGARDERLVTDPELTSELEAAGEDCHREHERIRTEMDELSDRYVATLKRAADAEGPDRDRLKQRAVRLKREYKRLEGEQRTWQCRLAAVCVIRVCRTAGDGVPDPESVEGPVIDRLSEVAVDYGVEIDFDCLRLVREALDIEPDALVWLPDPEPKWDPPGGGVDGELDTVEFDLDDAGGSDRDLDDDPDFDDDLEL